MWRGEEGATQHPAFLLQGSQCRLRSAERDRGQIEEFLLLVHWPPDPKVGALLFSEAFNLLGFGYLSSKTSGEGSDIHEGSASTLHGLGQKERILMWQSPPPFPSSKTF